MVAQKQNAHNDQKLLDKAGVVFPKGAKVTPMLRQWLEAKAVSKDAVLLFRMGDFYELFHTDAVLAGEVLELSVTTRDRDKGESSISMAGFPHHAAPNYIAKLVAAGMKVAVCDQLEDPALAKGIVKRGITRMVTPGMVLDDESLQARSNNFLVSVYTNEEEALFGLAALDVSTGEFKVAATSSLAQLLDEVTRLMPRELLVQNTAIFDDVFRARASREVARTELRERPGRKTLLLDKLGAKDRMLKQKDHLAACYAAEMVLVYVEETQGKMPSYLSSPLPYGLELSLLIDATTRKHLDVAGDHRSRRAPGTLLHVIDKTATATGGRFLMKTLFSPSADLAEIESRHDRVQAFVDDPGARERLREELRGIYDLERLCARVCASRASPRDLLRLKQSLERLPKVASILDDTGLASFKESSTQMRCLADLGLRLRDALVDEVPLQLGQGPVFRPGFSSDLDELEKLTSGGREALAELESKEREATGIGSLKVKHNRVFGYFIEVTRTHLPKVPERYIRKQTIANGERFLTEELTRLEDQVASAEQKHRRREAELYEELCAEIAAAAKEMLQVAQHVAEVDTWHSFARVSAENDYVRPQLVAAEERRLVLEGVRHPVVEQMLALEGERFVPTDLLLDGDKRQVLLITGPNMAGKSTLMRQVALVQLLAQAGCFVPASRAKLSLCDRIFTRVGANDDLAEGRSTFMVEMTETANILKNATATSLVLLDEIGRGTSTFDGISIAWSVAEHLHDEVGARTLFATHYHELTDLAEHHERIQNIHVVVKEWNDEIVFTRSIAEGGAGQSYGIQVARLAGVPQNVLARAKRVLALLEGDESASLETNDDDAQINAPSSLASSQGLRKKIGLKKKRPQLDLFGGTRRADVTDQALADDEPALEMQEAPVVDALLALKLDHLTPLQALNKLSKLVDDARKWRAET
ncbi:MAG: DNA mismatch repair protein MutS [Deltaproteobacteria bacterium]|nr:DNA mismatch repair protein MutS [Deltaproteobacteria bacterium]